MISESYDQAPVDPGCSTAKYLLKMSALAALVAAPIAAHADPQIVTTMPAGYAVKSCGLRWCEVTQYTPGDGPSYLMPAADVNSDPPSGFSADPPSAAPEIDSAGTIAGLTLALGVLLLTRGRRRI